MTDWWAMSNREGYEATKTTHAPMVSAGNDVFMVCTDCSDMGQDDVKEALENGEITRGDLQRNAMNVLHFILGTPSILRFLDRISEEEKEAQEKADAYVGAFSAKGRETGSGTDSDDSGNGVPDRDTQVVRG